MRTARAWLAAAALVAIGAVAVALVSQHAFGIEPCAWCVLQRLVYLAIVIAALVGIVLPGRIGRRTGAALMGVFALAGIAAALWQHFVAARSASCNLTLADRIVGGLGLDTALPEVFTAYASCADAAVDLAGVPYDYWSLAGFAIVGLVALRVLAQPR
jgi:disulfide bond formation protein DsbB